MITLKSIAHATRLSQETNAFAAHICWNGKKVGEAENNGHGGETRVYLDYDRETTRETLDAWVAAQPPLMLDNDVAIPMRLDLYIDGLINTDLIQREYRRLCRGHLVFKIKSDPKDEYRTVKATADQLDRARAWAIKTYGEQVDYFLNDRLVTRGAFRMEAAR